jgi:hypothetical protein
MALEGTGVGGNRDAHRNAVTNQPIPDDGTLATQAYNYAVAHQQTSGNGLPTFKPEMAMTYQAQRDPNFQAPSGYKLLPDRSVIYDPGSWWDRYGMMLIAGGVLGVGAGAALAGAAGGGTIAGGGAAESAIPGIAISSTPYAGAVGATTASAVGGSASGGVLGTAGKIAGLYGKTRGALETAGTLAQGRAEGRAAEAGINQAQDRNAITAAQVNLGAGKQRAGQAVRGDILAHAQPFKFTGSTHMVGNIPVPDSEGGLSPSIFSDTTRQLGRTLSSDALTAQTTDHGNPAQLTPVPQAGTFDKILSTAGTIGALYDGVGGGTSGYLSALAKYRQKRQPEYQDTPDFTAGYG